MLTNWTTVDDNLYEERDISGNIALFAATYGIFGGIGSILNGFTIAVIVKGKHFGQNIRLQLLNISVIDLLCCMVTPTTIVLGAVTTIPYPNSNTLCQLQQYLTYSLFYVSLLVNAAIAIEKFIAVYFPLTILKYERRHIVSVIILAWTLAFLLHIDVAIDSLVYPNPDANHTLACLYSSSFVTPSKGDYQLFTMKTALKYLVPSFTILTAYILIAIKLKQKKEVGDNTFNRKTINRQVSNTLALLLLLYVDFIAGKYVV